MVLRTVTAGSVTTSCADATAAPSRTTDDCYKRAPHANPPLPCPTTADARCAARRLCRPTKAALAARRVTPAGELHVDGDGLSVALALAARQQLLERVREELIGDHVLATREQLASRDLVQNGGHLVIARQAVQDVVLEALNRLLQATVISAS